MSPLTLLESCLRFICSAINSGNLSLANLNIPLELCSKLLNCMLSTGMLTDNSFKQLLMPQFQTLQLFGAVRLTDSAFLVRKTLALFPLSPIYS